MQPGEVGEQAQQPRRLHGHQVLELEEEELLLVEDPLRRHTGNGHEDAVVRRW